MKNIFKIVSIFITAFLLFYTQMPVLRYGFSQIGFIVLIISVILFASFSSMKFVQEGNNINFDKGKKPVPVWIKYLFLASLVYVVVLPFITSSPLFHAQKYQQLIGKVNIGKKISDHIIPISLDEVRIVDQNLANLVGEKVLGSQPALGSQVELGEFCIQKVNNQLVWVAPLEHSGFFKWFNNSEGTPGYVMVSVTNERDVKLVQSIQNKPIKIKYQEGAFFWDYLRRHVYFNGYSTVGLTDFSFEIDDSGKPFWVITTFEKSIGFSGKSANGVVIVDAQSGDIQGFGLNDVPKWVDRVQPSNFIQAQLDDWGEYVNGYWNFANTDKLQTTEGMILVYGKDNKSYWYTGLTSVGKDESTVGFMLVDTRTKETTYYKQSGATEVAAQHSAEGKVQEKEYRATTPIPYNINNIPTYVMALKDNGGLVKMYAMVGINDYTVVGVGNTLRETLTSFKNTYNMTGNKLSGNTPTVKKEMISTIVRIQNDVKNGNSFYYFILKDSPKVFVGSSNISTQLPISQVGDKIKVTYDEDLEKIIDISTFENMNLK
ncbi:MAG: hypothetical protein U5N85_17255 [Arcicella sp.]|nr:hypothetical protein [Arcicella sp.]